MRDEDESVLLVDADDVETGVAPKLAAHQAGQRHRAISVLIADSQGRMLLQRRAMGKYHSGGLWTNACCSHPRVGETAAAAASRRLMEEMGVACPLRPLFVTEYRADVGGGLTEHEVVHVFGGRFDGAPKPDPEEASDFRWAEPEALAAEIDAEPERFSVWFRLYLERFGEVVRTL